jgi:hypothetical protein
MVLLVLCSLLAGCSDKSSWDSKVVSAQENPRNGDPNFGPVRAEIAEHRCGLLHEKCMTVRLVNESGYDDIFTYVGDDQLLKIRWTTPKNLTITCIQCTPTSIKYQLNQMDSINISYEL